MNFSNLSKPAALFAAFTTPTVAQAATIIVDYSPSPAGTPITIGASATPQYNFQQKDADSKTYLNANTGSFVGDPGIPATFSQAITAGGPAAFGDGDYNLLFNIGDTQYSGFATVDQNGERVHSITYDLAASVPEPAAWAMMILGLGGVGVAMRRRRQAVGVAIA